MSYTELEHGYQGLRKARPAFYVGEDAVNVRLVKNRVSKFTIKNYIKLIFIYWIKHCFVDEIIFKYLPSLGTLSVSRFYHLFYF